MSRRDRLVYSSDGSHLPRPREAEDKKTAPAGPGAVRVSREKKGRRGKTVTVVTGLPLGSEALRELAGDLKRACGSGGAAKDGNVEIQGDHVDRVLAALKELGYSAKRSGG